MLGEHPGAQAYTVGQRKGLALGRPPPTASPASFWRCAPRKTEVIVGSRELLAVHEIRGIRATWAGVPVEQAARFLEQPRSWYSQRRVRSDRTGARRRPVRAKAYMTWASDPEAEEEDVLPGNRSAPTGSALGVAPGQTMVL